MAIAKCQLQHKDPGFFHPMPWEDGKRESVDDIQAKRAEYCHGVTDDDVCMVREQCLEYALRTNEYGVWGGTTEKERLRIRRNRRRSA